MDGIQLLGAPSTNWKPARSFSAQNHGISGNETANPRKPKMLPIQRMASLFSFGTSMRRTAPTSGVNKIIERIWLYIYLALSLVERTFRSVSTRQNPVERAFRPASNPQSSDRAGL